MNQMRLVAKRDNLYTLSLFALKLWLFRLKYVLKLRKHTFKNVDKLFRGAPVWRWISSSPTPGTDMTGKCPAAAQEEGGRGWNWLMH